MISDEGLEAAAQAAERGSDECAVVSLTAEGVVDANHKYYMRWERASELNNIYRGRCRGFESYHEAIMSGLGSQVAYAFRQAKSMNGRLFRN